MRKTSFVVVSSLLGSAVVFACGGSSGGGGGTGGTPDSGTKSVVDSSTGTTDTGTSMVIDSGSGSGTGTATGSGTGTGTGSGSGTGTGTGSGSGTGTGTGTGSGSGTGGDAGFVCDQTSQCPSGDICCGRIPITGGTLPNCTQSGITVDCETQTACPSSVQFACTAGTSEVVHLCQSAADCADDTNGYTQCCTFGESGQSGSLQFCASTLVALGGTNCM